MSYIHLPSHLKACFAYCALFPKDYVFIKKDLILLWMTENFLHCRQHSKITEEVCQQYFNDLLSRSFFQQLGGSEKLFVMHDLLNDLAKYVGGGIYFRWKVDQVEKIQKVTRHFSIVLGHIQYFDDFGTLCNTRRFCQQRAYVSKFRYMNCCLSLGYYISYLWLIVLTFKSYLTLLAILNISVP